MAKAKEATRRDAGVDVLLAKAKHPLAQEIEMVRSIMLAIDPSITEAVKWNTASYRTTDFFAAIHLRSEDTVQLVFHMGAKVKATAKTGVSISDPAGLCKWLGKDRCLVTLGVKKEVKEKQRAFEAFVREWIRHVT